MRKILWPLFSIFAFSASSQELNCRVILNTEQVQSPNKSLFKEIEVTFSEFMNNTKWTNDQFAAEERINCNIIITLNPESSDPSTGKFVASVQILSSRPVFNASYETVLFNFADRDWAFEFLPSQPIIFNDKTFQDNVSSLLSYYAYIIIGLDYDSFSQMGGTQYFQAAWQIVTNAQQSGYPGWEQFNSIRNRYWLAENLLNSQMAPLREAIYEYHIKGLDIFYDKPDEARKVISDGIKKVYNVNQARPRSILTVSFLDAKAEEIKQVFSDGDMSLRRNTYNLLVNIDPTKRQTFEPMIK